MPWEAWVIISFQVLGIVTAPFTVGETIERTPGFAALSVVINIIMIMLVVSLTMGGS